MSITVGTRYQKQFVHPCGVRSANTIQLVAALIVTLPIPEMEVIDWNGELVGCMAWSLLTVTLEGGSLLDLLILRTATVSVASLMFLVPSVLALMTYALFSEPITVMTIGETALTAIGVALVVRKRVGN